MGPDGTGEVVTLDACSGWRSVEGEGKDWVGWRFDELGSCAADDCVGNGESAWYGGESLRFLWEDVVMVKKALLPEGNKAGLLRNGNRDHDLICRIGTEMLMLPRSRHGLLGSRAISTGVLTLGDTVTVVLFHS